MKKTKAKLQRQAQNAAREIMRTSNATIERLANGNLVDQVVAAYCRLLLVQSDTA